MDNANLEALLKKAREIGHQRPELDYITIIDTGDFYAVTFVKPNDLELHEIKLGDYWWEVWEQIPYTHKSHFLNLALDNAIEKVEKDFKIIYD